MMRAMMRKEKKKGLSHRDIFRKAQKKTGRQHERMNKTKKRLLSFSHKWSMAVKRKEIWDNKWVLSVNRRKISKVAAHRDKVVSIGLCKSQETWVLDKREIQMRSEGETKQELCKINNNRWDSGTYSSSRGARVSNIKEKQVKKQSSFRFLRVA